MSKTRIALCILAALSIGLSMPAVAADAADDARLQGKYESMSSDQLADAMFTEMERMTDLLESITDVETAQQTLPALEKVGHRLELMGAVGEKMEAGLSEQEQKALEEKYTPRIEKIMAKMMPAMMRIAMDESNARELSGFLDNPVPAGVWQP